MASSLRELVTSSMLPVSLTHNSPAGTTSKPEESGDGKRTVPKRKPTWARRLWSGSRSRTVSSARI
eukprot:6577293-Prymnesium_polylepis.1